MENNAQSASGNNSICALLVPKTFNHNYTHIFQVPEPDIFCLASINVGLVVDDTDSVSNDQSHHEVLVNCQPITVKGSEIAQKETIRPFPLPFFVFKYIPSISGKMTNSTA